MGRGRRQKGQRRKWGAAVGIRLSREGRLKKGTRKETLSMTYI
jgi:hypothetical protein